MKHTYHVITPVSRFENIAKLARMLAHQCIQWHLLIDSECPFRLQFDYVWIHTHVIPTEGTEFYARCNSCINWFLDHYWLHPTNRYCILNDDDAYEPDFFKKIDEHEGEVVVASMERGHQTPANVEAVRAHGTGKLTAAAENMHPGYVGIEQLIATGKVFSTCRIPLSACGDGEMLQWVSQNYTVNYAPEANVWFNYYEPGRWNK